MLEAKFGDDVLHTFTTVSRVKEYMLCCVKLNRIMQKASSATFVRAEAVVGRCSVKRLFFEVSQNIRENTCAT